MTILVEYISDEAFYDYIEGADKLEQIVDLTVQEENKSAAILTLSDGTKLLISTSEWAQVYKLKE